MQVEAARALRAQLETYDRDKGVWHGVVATLEAEALVDEDSWRAALSDIRISRDIAGWHPAVVLQVGNNDARIGIENVADDADGHWIAAKDVTWPKSDARMGRWHARRGWLETC